MAAYGVVLSHYLMAHLSGRAVMNGVDIFFLISGFLVWVICDRVSPSPLQFLAHRAARIAPLYWAVTAVQLALALAMPTIFGVFDATWRNVALSSLFVPHLDVQGRIWPFITQGWTLNLDVFYYVVFAAALAGPRRWRLALMTAALVVLAVVGAVIRPWHNGVVTWTYTNPLGVAFVAGLWIAEFWLRGRLKSRRAGVALIALGLLVYLLQTLRDTPYASSSIYIWVLASASALTGLLCLEGSGVRLEWAAMRRLADWTYAIYLCHQMVRVACDALLPHVAWVQFVALVAGATLAGKVGYDLVELPVNRWLRGMEARHGPRASRLATAPISPTAELKDVAP